MSELSLSLIIPVLNEKENLPLLIQRSTDVLKTLDLRIFEIIFVDDGSTDESFSILKKAAEQDDRIKVLRLARNFGSHSACLAGLAHASGDRIIIMAADLQDPPELIPNLIQAQTKGTDVVWAQRESRNESRRILWFARMYHAFMKRFVFPSWPGDGADVVLISRRVRDAVLAWPEKNTSLFGQIFWLGFPSAAITYTKGKRHAGRSKWNFSRRLKLGLDSVVSFSFLPIRTIAYAGIAISFIGFLYALTIIILRLFHITQVPGWSALMVVILLVSGLQLLMLGVIGEYLWRSADQMKSRPAYVVTERIGLEERDKISSFLN